MFFEIGVLKNFAIFSGKHLCWSVFLIKLQACNFPVNTANFVRTAFFKKSKDWHSWANHTEQTLYVVISVVQTLLC